ncbi:MAG TPA: two-component regulator propeller domain-containing protein [Candidatus Polarisedimenticolaceae bacterium]|nr:two-component regulator propeller domain-containing protein [Candidatus Polarisedimenticolaceae bacterium]
MRLVVPGRRALAHAAVVVASCAVVRDALGLERLQRRFDLERGLPFSEINSIAQDSRGYLWITAGGALFRYDGVEVRPWARELERRYVKVVATGPSGEVLVREGPGDVGRLDEVVGDAIRPVVGRDGAPVVIVGKPIWDRTSRIWAIGEDRIWSKPAGGAWTESSAANSGRPTLLEVSEDGAPILVTRSAISRLDAGGAPGRLAAIEGVQRASVRADGSLVVLHVPPGGGGRVVSIRGAETRELFRMAARPIDMVERSGTLWVAYDSSLVALRPGSPPEILGPREGVPSGGPLLVDREGSLWLASYRGLLQYPAPDTVAWSSADGMASPSVRRLALADEGVWVDSWGGLTLLRGEGASWRPERVPDTGTSAVCMASDGTMWAGAAGRFVSHRRVGFVSLPQPGLTNVGACTPGASGRMWLSTNLGLMVSSGETPSPRVGPTAFHGASPVALLEDRDGRLWASAGEDVCHADAGAVAGGSEASWGCSRIEGAGEVTSLAEIAPGEIWAGTLLAGVYRSAGTDRFERIAGSSALPTPLVRRLRASPSGGAWIVSFGTIVRAVARPGTEAGWEIVERPSPWHGLMISDAEDLVEDASGDLWIATLAGLVRIPFQVRRAPAPVPPVELEESLVEGRPLPREGRIGLPYRHNTIELRFAALSYRDPSRLRYQVRLGPDAPWLDASSRPSFQFVNLPPGRYHAEVRGSLDGAHWSAAPASVAFDVLPPFWRTWWFVSLAALAAALSALALYRYRVAQLIRIERVRAHIATDLHDDIGATLSQIAILSEVARKRLARGAGEVAPLLETVAREARRVVGSMSDVVWAVDPRHDRAEDLALRMRRYAEDTCAAQGIALVFSAQAPDGGRLDPRLRRQTFLLFKESVNNAAKHAACRTLTVDLRVEGGALDLVVTDDGRGFDVAATPAGTGLASLRQRSAALGGACEISSNPAAGTTVAVHAPLRQHRDANPV